MPTISLCMIVKNEEQFLEQCLQSVQGLVDEIIVVDTGSVDKTKEIALRYTQKVSDFAWCNDFSAARNESLKYATGDWILVLDADEAIAKEDHQNIRNLINEIEAVGYILIQRNYFRSSQDLDYGYFSGIKVSAGSQDKVGFVSAKGDSYIESKDAEGWLATPIVRLFRNSPGVAFKGVVHEDVSPSLKGKIFLTAVPLHHFGKLDKEKWQKKWKSYEQLAEKKALNEKKDYYAYFELGRQYLENRKIGLAKEMFQQSLVLNNYFWLSWFNLGTIDLMENKVDEAIMNLEQAKALNSGVWPIYENLGVAYSRKKLFQKAIESFQEGIKLNPHQASIFKNLGLCYDEMGEKEKAYQAFKKAIELNPAYGEQIKLG